MDPLLNNREVATVAWAAVLALFALRSEKVRQSAAAVFRSLVHPKLLTVLAASAGYTAFVVWGLSRWGLWSTSLAKDSVVWFAFTAFTLLLGSTDKVSGRELVVRTTVRTWKVVAIASFLVSEFPFSLGVELLFVPALAFVVMIGAVAKYEKDAEAVVSLADFITAFAGLVMVGFALYSAWVGWEKFGTSASLIKFTHPFVLSLAFVPVLFLVAVLSAYEQVMVLTKFRGGESGSDFARQAWWMLAKTCGLSLAKLRHLLTVERWGLISARGRDDLQAVIESAFGPEGSFENADDESTDDELVDDESAEDSFEDEKR